MAPRVEQVERMELPPVSDDWAVHAFTIGLNERSSEQRFTEREPRSNKERYQPYVEDRRNAPRHNTPRGDRRMDRGQNSQGLVGKAGFDRHTGPVEAPWLSECNFNVDVSGIVSAIGKIKDARWPKPVLSDPSQRNPNLMCKYHGTHGHRIEDCRQLGEEVARLFNEGHLREFLSDRA
ncbi:PREDICTED: uncharacterized protein LOC109208393 [Nicotiana attenuata]|uniref:uncharacterized protein LOC109208002 n=1 Tax=Nicotiana attenuata TaxID=49451 RepID=UPI000904D6ED|nr:PREDICTED: uncharacterized protein LOC109208002 [Nicotiana attenuata]XP_019227049.1 PREDICTED: uncharacterized protein LOC109208393 [Nicotiana attenuata]